MSVIVKYDPSARLGNRMFQLAFGYLLAKDRGDNLYHDGMGNFNIHPLRGTPTNGRGYKNTRQYGNNYVPYDELATCGDNVIVDSFVQKAEYYIDRKSDLELMFGVAYKCTPVYNSPPDELTLHIRETDYIQIGCCLDYQAYKNIIDESGCKQVLIVTDNSNCELVQRLVAEGCRVSTEGYVDKFDTSLDDRGLVDFTRLLWSRNLALSHSSFSWWAAFLGIHDQILFPYGAGSYMWKEHPGQDDIDLFFDYGQSKKVQI